MKPYLFAVSVLLMLFSAGAGLTWFATSALSYFETRSRLLSLTCGVAALFAVIGALAWSVPSRG